MAIRGDDRNRNFFGHLSNLAQISDRHFIPARVRRPEVRSHPCAGIEKAPGRLRYTCIPGMSVVT